MNNVKFKELCGVGSYSSVWGILLIRQYRVDWQAEVSRGTRFTGCSAYLVSLELLIFSFDEV